MANEHDQSTQQSLCELGRSESADALLPLLYDELRALAHSWFARENQQGGTLQPTAVVHEAYVRLVSQDGRPWQDCKHFRALAAKAMRQILIDRARRRRAAKRGGERHRETLRESIVIADDTPDVDMLDFDEALSELSALNERQATITEMRFLGGCTVSEVATILGISERTVTLEWKMARAWLLSKLDRKQ